MGISACNPAKWHDFTPVRPRTRKGPVSLGQRGTQQWFGRIGLTIWLNLEVGPHAGHADRAPYDGDGQAGGS